jgi:predicted RNA-binding Zn-ribbon protein involved in translation (DUF1610 family)
MNEILRKLLSCHNVEQKIECQKDSVVISCPKCGFKTKLLTRNPKRLEQTILKLQKEGDMKKCQQ